MRGQRNSFKIYQGTRKIKYNGNVGIGTTSPNATLNVRGGVNVTGSVNLATLEGSVGIGTTSPGSYKLNVAGTVNASAYVTNGTDYAEMMEKLYDDEKIEAGDVVQVVKGKITKSNAKETGIFMVVTDSAGVIGNGGIVNGVPVAFVGQVRVKVLGKASAGDYMLPSGKGDGTAVAVPRAEMTLEKLMSAIGRAVELKNAVGVARIKVMVGIK